MRKELFRVYQQLAESKEPTKDYRRPKGTCDKKFITFHINFTLHSREVQFHMAERDIIILVFIKQLPSWRSSAFLHTRPY